MEVRRKFSYQCLALKGAGTALAVLASLAAPCRAGDPQTPSFAAPSLVQLLESTSHIGASHGDAPADPLLALRPDPQASLSLPLTLKAGSDGGVSFLYYSPPALKESADHGKPILNTERSTYGFSNVLALDGGAAHLKGLLYLNGGAGPSQIISQALDYAHGAWSFNAHYTDVGKDFNSFDAVRGAAPSLGLTSSLTTDTLAQLQNMRGKTDLGFAAHYAGNRENFAVSFQDIADAVNRSRTRQESLAFGKSFAGGLQLDLARDVVGTNPIDGTSGQALTSTTDHLRLAYDPGKGTSLFADARFLSNSQGHDEQHIEYGFAHKGHGLSLSADYKADGDSQGLSQSTEQLQMAWQASPKLSLDGLYTARTNPGGTAGTDRLQQVHLTWQLRKDLDFDGRIAQEMDSRCAHLGEERELLLKGALARNVTIDAHQLAKTSGQTGQADVANDVRATVAVPRFAGMRSAQWMLSLSERIAQDRLVQAARSLTFEAQTRLTQFHLEYAGNLVTVGDHRSQTSSRALRLVSTPGQGWLQYNLYYKQRAASDGTPLPDVRDYQLKMQLAQISLDYHYVSQQENPDGSVTDVVKTTYLLSGPLSRTLLWSAEFDRANVACGDAGTQGFLLGVKGQVGPKKSLEVGYGRQEVRAGAALVGGQTYKLNYQTKNSDDDYFSFDGQLTTWDQKTVQTPQQAVASVQLDVKKAY